MCKNCHPQSSVPTLIFLFDGEQSLHPSCPSSIITWANYNIFRFFPKTWSDVDGQVIGFFKLKVNMQIRVKNKIHRLLDRLMTCGKTFSDSRNPRDVPLSHESDQKGRNPAAFSFPTYLSVYVIVTLSPLKPSGLPCKALQEAVFLSLLKKGAQPIQSASFWRHALYVLVPPPFLFGECSNGKDTPDTGYLWWPTPQTYREII